MVEGKWVYGLSSVVVADVIVADDPSNEVITLATVFRSLKIRIVVHLGDYFVDDIATTLRWFLCSHCAYSEKRQKYVGENFIHCDLSSYTYVTPGQLGEFLTFFSHGLFRSASIWGIRVGALL